MCCSAINSATAADTEVILAALQLDLMSLQLDFDGKNIDLKSTLLKSSSR